VARKNKTVKEMFSRNDPWWGFASTSLRQSWSAITKSFYGTPYQPVLRKTTVDVDKARALYFNTDPSISFGAHFAKPIIDSAADFIGAPSYHTGNETIDTILQDCVEKYWKSSLWETWKIMMRDSKCWVRMRGMPINALTTPDEVGRVYLEPIVKERVTPIYDPYTNELMRIEVSNIIFVEDEESQVAINSVLNPARHSGREHEIIEIITPDEYRYYDATDERELENLRTTNQWGFIGFVEFVNEADSSLDGGISDLEGVYPFLQAHHDIFTQTKVAHKQHAVPKVKFKINDILPFIQNNFPDAIDQEGNFTGRITWSGKEILFMQSEEDAEFLEAKTALDGSVSLLEFVLDSIAIASERPEWIFMRNEGIEAQSSQTPQTLPFKNLIWRKRANAEESLIKLGKMAQVVYAGTALRPDLSWGPIEMTELVQESQALQQITASAEIANRAGVIDRTTYRQKIRRFYPGMKSNADEEASAQTELQAEQDRQLEVARQQAEIKAETTAKAAKSNGAGPNSTRDRLPLDVVPPGD